GVAAYQRLDSRWDAKSEEFDPERWLDGRVRQGEAIGHMLIYSASSPVRTPVWG
ncbi:hypothetical protein R3P38DRAFT_3140049, partial [Favolaschia claudopus]